MRCEMTMGPELNEIHRLTRTYVDLAKVTAQPGHLVDSKRRAAKSETILSDDEESFSGADFDGVRSGDRP